MQIIEVHTKSRPSTVLCGAGAAEAASEYLRGAQVFVVTDSNVARLYSEKIGKLFPGAPVCVIPAGERHKNRTGLFRILDGMLNARLHRSSVVVAFGGGVVGDMAGLAAALYMRGTRIVQMPTTLLAQVDSSVGGKTAVDYRGVKNVIGAFYQPERVFCDPLFFETLPAREIRCGLGEVIKTGLLDETVGGAIRANTGRPARPFLSCIPSRRTASASRRASSSGTRRRAAAFASASTSATRPATRSNCCAAGVRTASMCSSACGWRASSRKGRGSVPPSTRGKCVRSSPASFRASRASPTRRTACGLPFSIKRTAAAIFPSSCRRRAANTRSSRSRPTATRGT